MKKAIILGLLAALAWITIYAGPAQAADDKVEVLGDSHIVRSVNYFAPDAIGYWHGGWTMPMLDSYTKPGADILVLGAGTNDIRLGVPIWETRKAFDVAAQKSGAERVILLAVPPRSANGTGWKHNDQNEAYKKIALARGWDYYDAWSGYRASNGAFVSGCSCTTDGVHATDAVYKKIASRIAKVIDRGLQEGQY